MKAVITEGVAASGRDRRRYARAPLRLPGRYLLEDGSEHSCECLDISVGGLRLKAARAGAWGSKVIAYIDDFGRVEGYVVRRAPGWFAIEVHATERKESRLVERIEALLSRDIKPTVERRGSDRFHQARELVMLTSSNGQTYEAELADVSAQGAAVLADGLFAIGELVGIGKKYAKVIRVFPGGVALEFEHENREARRVRARPPARATRESYPADG